MNMFSSSFKQIKTEDKDNFLLIHNYYSLFSPKEFLRIVFNLKCSAKLKYTYTINK